MLNSPGILRLRFFVVEHEHSEYAAIASLNAALIFRVMLIAVGSHSG